MSSKYKYIIYYIISITTRNNFSEYKNLHLNSKFIHYIFAQNVSYYFYCNPQLQSSLGVLTGMIPFFTNVASKF